jgi:catechol 2,3-dioxygenase-like lactoylglutathione lyase family enzyme
MPLIVRALDHIQLCVPPAVEAEAKRFYGELLGLREVPKPGVERKGGAWYEQGGVGLHVSIEDGADSRSSKRHVCFLVASVDEAETALRAAGVEIIADKDPIPGWRRFYVRDPGGNRVEIAEDGGR